jgi:hypothetical protein
MNLTHAIAPDELLLAQLASAKLAMLIKGLMSVGVGALQLASPGGFFTGRDKVLLAFIEVLRCVGVGPGFGEGFDRLRGQADQLAGLASQFHQHFLELVPWRTLPPRDVRAAADRLFASYAELCQALAAFQALIGVPSDYSDQVQEGRELLGGFLKELLKPTQDDQAGG